MPARDMIIMAAPNGARRMKHDHPALPMTAAEMAQEARACAKAGMSVLHLHVRDGRDGGHSLDAGLYRQSIAAVRAALDDEVVVQITTEAVGMYTAAQQRALVRELRPEAVSLAYRELFAPGYDAGEAKDFLGWMAEAGVWPQFILFGQTDLQGFVELYERGLCPYARPYLLFVLGQYGRREAAPEDLAPFLDTLGARDWPWAVCSFGRREAECVAAAARAGGHARVGFENNLWLPDGARAPDNAALVGAAVEAAKAEGRRIMSADEVRRFANACRG